MESNLSSTSAATDSSEGTLKKRPLPSFVKKLWFILADVPSHEHIFWVDNGQVICVPNASSFSKVILPRFFKHNNWQSFVRQLNLYGFRKVYQLNLSYDESTEKRTVWQFKHERFKKDHPEKLCEIKRRASKGTQQQQQQASNSSQAIQQQQPPFNFKNTNLQQQQQQQQQQQTTSELGLNGEPIEQTLKRFANRIEQADKKRKELWEQTVRLSQIQARQQKAIRVLMEFIIQYLENHPDSENDKIRFTNIMQKIMEQESNIEEILPFDDTMMMSSGNDEGDEDEEEEDEIEEDEKMERSSNIECQQQQYQQLRSTYTTYPQYMEQHPQQQSYMQQPEYPPPQSGYSQPPQQYLHSQPQPLPQQHPPQQEQLPSISSLITNHSSHILPPLRKRPKIQRD